jgi:hypothetical protein
MPSNNYKRSATAVPGMNFDGPSDQGSRAGSERGGPHQGSQRVGSQVGSLPSGKIKQDSDSASQKKGWGHGPSFNPETPWIFPVPEGVNRRCDLPPEAYMVSTHVRIDLKTMLTVCRVTGLRLRLLAALVSTRLATIFASTSISSASSRSATQTLCSTM